MNWRDLSHWFVGKLQGSITVDVQEAQNKGSELTFVTRTELPTGSKVRVTLPTGATVPGLVNWTRQSGDEHIVALDLAEVPEPLTLPDSSRSLRRSPRFPYRQWIHFEEGLRLGTVTSDLSVEGCRVEADLKKHVGECHVISLELPGSSRIVRATAKILWSRKSQAGLRFLNMHVDDEAALSRALGLQCSRSQQLWSDLWRKSLDGLSYRLTPSSEGLVSLDIQLPNWLVTFSLGQVSSRGAECGAFTTLEVRRRSDELRLLQQEIGISLHDPARPIHLELRDAEGEIVLAVWGLERDFRRTALNQPDELPAPPRAC